MAVIDVGPGAVNRASSYTNDYTLIDLSNPANGDGYLDTVEIWAAQEMSGTRVGTFERNSTSNFTSRDSAIIGSVSSGSKQTFSGLSIGVETNDNIGLYYSDGQIEGELSGGLGIYYISGNQIGAGEQTYSLFSGDIISLYATGLSASQGICEISAVSSLSALQSAIFVGACPVTSTPSLESIAGAIRNASTPIESIASLDITGLRNKFGVLSIVAIPSLYIDIRSIARCAIISESSLSSSANVIFSGVVPIDIISSLIADGSAGVLAAVTILSVASITASGVKYANGAVTITARSSADIEAISYISQLMGYTGTLTAGDVLVIDCDEQTVELNGANATQYFTGHFPMLEVGNNLLVWEDGGEVPDVDFETTHKPRYL